MINQASDYIHVVGANIDASHPHGDLDRILIDGGIMPLRGDPADRTPLRGEDIAFLAEAMCERRGIAWPTNRNQLTFSRKVSSRITCDINNAILNDLNLHSAGYDGPNQWFMPSKRWQSGMIATSSSIWDHQNFLNRGDYENPSDAFVVGNPLRRAYMVEMFDMLGKMERYGFQGNPNWLTWDTTISGSSSSPITPFPTGHYIYEQTYSRSQGGGEWTTSKDFVQKTTTASFQIGGTDSRRASFFGSIEAWALVVITGFRTRNGQTIFNDSVRRMMKLGDMTILGDLATIDISNFHTQSLNLLAEIGYEPTRPAIDEDFYESGQIFLDFVDFPFCGTVRDRTRWS